MKKIIALVMFLGLCVISAHAEETAGAYFKWGGVEFTYPLANTSAIALYDIWDGCGLVGAETRLVSWKRLNLNGGAVTSLQANGMPFVSLDFDWCGLAPTTSEKELAKIGVWFGRDFKVNDNHAGIKASVSLWGK